MKLSDKPCYPITPEQYYAEEDHPEITGLTFRERLIIEGFGNPNFFGKDIPLGDSIQMVISSARELIKAAEDESK